MHSEGVSGLELEINANLNKKNLAVNILSATKHFHDKQT
jgi:hypothetical protein